MGALALAVAALCLWLLPGASAALRPPAQALLDASQGLDQIDVEAQLLPESRTMTVCQTLRLVSRVDESRNSLVLRAWPNAYQSVDSSPLATEESYDLGYPDGFSAGSLVMEKATADMGAGEKSVVYRYTDQAKTVLTLPLPALWRKGEEVVIRLRYTIRLPNMRGSFGARNGVYALGNAFLLPAVWENGAYRTDPFPAVGEPFLSETANFTVRLTLPKGYQCAASAWPVETNASGDTTDYLFSVLAARDFAFVASDRFHLAQAMEGDVLVSAFAGSASDAKKALKYLTSSLRVYAEKYGVYPYQSLTLAEVDLPYGGMEYPGLAMVSKSLFQQGGKEQLEYLIAHEAAHQWWYAVVGSDPYNQAWQDEALCEYAVLGYMEAVHGRATRDRLYELNVAPSLRVTMPRGVTPGAPLSYFTSVSQYQTLVYNRGAAMLCALDEAMNGRLDGFLRAYYARFAFQIATRQDFSDLLANYTGEDFDPLMTDYLDTYIAP